MCRLEFWSAIVYSMETKGFIANASRVGISSYEKAELKSNPDGTVDLYFGPVRPEGAGERWIQTVPGRGWFSYFRIYGPQAPAFDGSWRPGDFAAQG